MVQFSQSSKISNETTIPGVNSEEQSGFCCVFLCVFLFARGFFFVAFLVLRQFCVGCNFNFGDHVRTYVYNVLFGKITMPY